MSSDNQQGNHSGDQDTSSALGSTTGATNQPPSQETSSNDSPTSTEQPLPENTMTTLEPIITESPRTSAFSDTSSQPSPTSTNITSQAQIPPPSTTPSQHTMPPPVNVTPPVSPSLTTPSTLADVPPQETSSTWVPGSPSQSTSQQPISPGSHPAASDGSIHTFSTNSQMESPQEKGKGRRLSTSTPGSVSVSGFASDPGYSQPSNSVFDEAVMEVPLNPQSPQKQQQQQHTRSLARNIVYNLNINSPSSGLCPLYSYQQHDFQPTQPPRVSPLYQERLRIQYQDLPQNYSNRGQHQSQREGDTQNQGTQQQQEQQELSEDTEQQRSEEDEVYAEYGQYIHRQQQQRSNSTSQNTTYDVNASYPWPPPNQYPPQPQPQPQPPVQPQPQSQPPVQSPINVGVLSNSITYLLLIFGMFLLTFYNSFYLVFKHNYTLISNDVLLNLTQRTQQVPELSRIMLLPAVNNLELEIDNSRESAQEMKIVYINGTLHITPYKQATFISYPYTVPNIAINELHSPNGEPTDKEEDIRIQKLQDGVRLLRERLESQQEDIKTFQEKYITTEFTFNQLLDTLEMSIVDKNERDNALIIVQLASRALSDFEDNMDAVRQQYVNLKTEFNKLYEIVRMIHQTAQ